MFMYVESLGFYMVSPYIHSKCIATPRGGAQKRCTVKNEKKYAINIGKNDDDFQIILCKVVKGGE